jgi:glycosyltransferase involved in cell wall biosynthesis
MQVSITVIDNNCTDATRAIVHAAMARADGRLQLTQEPKQGRSSALNRGIAVTQGDLVAMVDDDEEIDAGWYHTIEDAFADPDLDFIGGPYVPIRQEDLPSWIPAEYGAVIGVVDGGDQERAYDSTFPGILMGGNAVVRRRMLDRIGAYDHRLGRTGSRLLSGEDRDFYDRLLASGARGRYIPHLIVYHHIPMERCTKEYFRRWLFWHGVSLGLLERHDPSDGIHMLGIPRWRFRSAAAGAMATIGRVFGRSSDTARAFAAELQLREFFGLLYGRHLYGRGSSDSVSQREPARPA